MGAAATHRSSLQLPSNNEYDDFLAAIYAIRGTVTATEFSLGINLSTTVEEGIISGRFGILAGDEVARDGQRYTGGFRDIGDVINGWNGDDVELMFGFEDWNDNDYNDGRLLIKIGENFNIDIDEDNVAKNANFLAGKDLIIPYKFLDDKPKESDMGFEIESLRSSESFMKTPTATITHDYANRRLKVTIPQNTGSSTSWYDKKTVGLMYEIIYKVNGSIKQRFTIEQDDINRARQEYQARGLSYQDREKFGVIQALYLGETPRKNYPKEAFLEDGYKKIYDILKATYYTITFTSTWRNPYFNKAIRSGDGSKHLLVKTKSEIKVLLLEGNDNKSGIFRSAANTNDNGWYKVPDNSTNFLPKRTDDTWRTREYDNDAYGLPNPFPHGYVKPPLGNVLSDHFHMSK